MFTFLPTLKDIVTFLCSWIKIETKRDHKKEFCGVNIRLIQLKGRRTTAVRCSPCAEMVTNRKNFFLLLKRFKLWMRVLRSDLFIVFKGACKRRTSTVLMNILLPGKQFSSSQWSLETNVIWKVFLKGFRRKVCETDKVASGIVAIHTHVSSSARKRILNARTYQVNILQMVSRECLLLTLDAVNFSHPWRNQHFVFLLFHINCGLGKKLSCRFVKIARPQSDALAKQQTGSNDDDDDGAR